MRNRKIFDADHIISKFEDWIGRVGYENYQKEFEKWPETPSYRDGSQTYTDVPQIGGYYASIYSLYNFIRRRIELLDSSEIFDYNV